MNKFNIPREAGSLARPFIWRPKPAASLAAVPEEVQQALPAAAASLAAVPEDVHQALPAASSAVPGEDQRDDDGDLLMKSQSDFSEGYDVPKSEGFHGAHPSPQIPAEPLFGIAELPALPAEVPLHEAVATIDKCGTLHISDRFSFVKPEGDAVVPLDGKTFPLTEIPRHPTAYYKTWLVIKMLITSDDEFATLCSEIFKDSRAAVVARLDTTEVVIVLRKQRATISQFDELMNMDRDLVYYTIDKAVHSTQFAQLHAEFIVALQKASLSYESTFYLKEFTIDMHKEEEDIIKAVEEEMSNLPETDRIRAVMRARIKEPKSRTAHEKAIVACEGHLGKLERAEKRKRDEFDGMKIMALASRLLSKQTRMAIYKNLKVFGMNIHTGESLSFVRPGPDGVQRFGNTLMDFMMYEYSKEYAIVLLGEPGLGKTPLAEAMCSDIAQIRWPEDNKDQPYFVKTSTLDNLREVQELLTSYTPVLVDDFGPNDEQADKLTKSEKMEKMKHFLNQKGSENVAARYKDVRLAAGVSRIITSNAATPHAWFDIIPSGIERALDDSFTAAQRLALCNSNAKIILKRVVFVMVRSQLIPAQVASAFTNAAATSTVDRALAHYN